MTGEKFVKHFATETVAIFFILKIEKIMKELKFAKKVEKVLRDRNYGNFKWDYLKWKKA